MQTVSGEQCSYASALKDELSIDAAADEHDARTGCLLKSHIQHNGMDDTYHRLHHDWHEKQWM